MPALRRRARRARAGRARCGSSIDREGGVDLDAITARDPSDLGRARRRRRAIAGPFLLEVSSPGLERPLRRPEHFAGAIGETVTIKFHTDSGPAAGARHARRRRRRRTASSRSTARASEIAYDAITQARTVFEWGPQPRPAEQGDEDAGRRRRRRHEESRDARGALRARSREGDLRRDHARGAGERARHRVQAHARSRRGSARRDRRRDRRDPRDRAGARRRRQRRPRVGRHARRLRSHRRADGQAGDPAAHPRGRARDEVRGVRRAAKATSSPASSSRPTPATRCSTSVGSRRCCRRPSRSRATATTTARA